jgi:UDP-2,3-diacylglucosamine pyrophosphatase LpxH
MATSSVIERPGTGRLGRLRSLLAATPAVPFRLPEPNEPTPDPVAQRYRTIWISDVHLGTRDAKAELLLDFLKHTDAETMYLVGDLFDGWALKRSWYWRQSHNDVVQKILRKVRKGTRVIYLPGNHDEIMRGFTGLQFGGVHVEPFAIHTAADGRRYLVLHGDQFDGVVRHAKWLALLGDHAYKVALVVNRWLNVVRRRLGLPYWSLSAYLKRRVKNAVDFMSSFESAVAHEAHAHGVDGVICGHIHHAQMREIDGLAYANDGDWVESCTALVEHDDGQLEILRWAEIVEQRTTPARVA